MFIAQIVLSALVALLFLFTGISKLVGAEVSRADANRFGMSYSLFRIIGALEVAGAAGLIVGLFVSTLAVAAALGLVLLMTGGVITHLRAKDPVAKAVPAFVVGLISAVVFVLALTQA